MEGLKKGVPKQRGPNMIQAIQQKPNEDPYEFLERIYQAYWKHTDADPQVPQNVHMVNMTFIGQSALDIRRKLQHLNGAVRMNPSQVVGIAFTVYNSWESRKLEQVTVFLETVQENQKERWHLRGGGKTH